MIIFISGPYTAKTRQEIKQNIRKAEDLAEKVLLLGLVPVIPHKNTSFFDERDAFKSWEHNDWIERYCIPLLTRCDAILLTEGWENSKGAISEVLWAKENKMPIFYNIEELEESICHKNQN